MGRGGFIEGMQGAPRTEGEVQETHRFRDLKGTGTMALMPLEFSLLLSGCNLYSLRFLHGMGDGDMSVVVL